MIKWFFSEVNMYGNEQMKSGITGQYIVDKILGNKITNIDFFIYSTNNDWDNIKNTFINHIEEVWNIFNQNKIKIVNIGGYFTFNIYNVQCRIFLEKPYLRNIFTFQTLQYNWENKNFNLSHSLKSTDPLFLLDIINNIKRRRIIPLYPNNLILNHDFFIADRDHFINIVENSYYLIKSSWHFPENSIRLHTTKEDICSICMNEDDFLKIKTNCNHVFHKDCIKQLFLSETKNSNLCPNCRSPIQIFYK